jgi:hypothetical protein
MADPYEKRAFWANGPEDKGFFTQGPRIRVGGLFNGTGLGVQCAGQTGVQASGTDFGVQGIGRGRAGRGGRFQGAELRAQVQLTPHAIHTRDPKGPSETESRPRELSGFGDRLPEVGATGDLYMTDVGNYGGALWLCVRGSNADGAARWCQVLLGESVIGGL